MKLLVVGEYPSLNEAGAPFTNGLWRYFMGMLRRVGFDTSPRSQDIGYANVVNTPAGNMFAILQNEKAGASKYSQYIVKGWYLRGRYDEDILALKRMIEIEKPNLILACGEIAMIVLTGQSKIDFARGRVTKALPLFNEAKVLPVYNPRSVLSDLSQEPILMMDLLKAKRECEFPEWKRKQRFLHLRPSLDDLEDFWNEYIKGQPLQSIDIETGGDTITCFGVAPTVDRALVVPFYDEEKPDGNYWPDKKSEVLAWRFVKRVCESREFGTLGQNLSYDAVYLLRRMGIPLPNWQHDTMLLHHALQPEMRKGLGFQASLYTDEPAWKGMHKRKSDDKTGKKEDE